MLVEVLGTTIISPTLNACKPYHPILVKKCFNYCLVIIPLPHIQVHIIMLPITVLQLYIDTGINSTDNCPNLVWCLYL
jgi:hypothetical protein